MMKVLYIESSPRKERSHSIQLAKTFLNAFQEKNPTATIDILDLWNEELPPFDGDTINAKYAVLNNKTPTGEQAEAWEVVKTISERFTAADKFVFSIPMWNYHIPYKLKHYIDVITQPGQTFNFSPDTGYEGLVVGKPVVTIYASGGSYQPGSKTEPFDHQKPYMRLWLNFVGLKDIRELVDDGTVEKGALFDEAKKLAEVF